MFYPFFMEIIFMDGEFTDLSPERTELMSIGLVKEDGEELYLEIDYETEPSDWVKKYVIPHMNGKKVSKQVAKEKIKNFIGDNKPLMMAYVNMFDWMGICDLFGISVNTLPFFWKPLDFATILYMKGFDITKPIEAMAEEAGIDTSKYNKHNALDDAKLLKEFYELISTSS